MCLLADNHGCICYFTLPQPGTDVQWVVNSSVQKEDDMAGGDSLKMNGICQWEGKGDCSLPSESFFRYTFTSHFG